MKEQRVVTFQRTNGERTSITISPYQLYVLDRLAKYLGLSRAKYLNKALNAYSEIYKNKSTCVKDEIIATLVKILITKGVKL